MVLVCFCGSRLVRFVALFVFSKKRLDAMQVDFPVREQHPRTSEINNIYNILIIR